MSIIRSNTSETTEYAREKIFSLLEHSGKTQQDLAASIGVSRFIVSQWHRGISNSFISANYLDKVASFFGVTTDYLIGKKDDSNSDEINDYLSELKNRPEMRQLFKVSKNATKEDVEQAVKIIEALKKPNDNDFDE